MGCFYISDQRLRIINHPEWLSNTLKENGFPMSEGFQVDDEDIKSNQVLVKFAHSRHRVFQTIYLEKGLELILSLLFRRYYFKEIQPEKRYAFKEGDRAAEWIAMIGLQFKKSLSRCEILCLNDLTGFERLHSILDCGLSLSAASMDVSHYISSQRLDRVLCLHIYREQLPSLHPIVVLLKERERV